MISFIKGVIEEVTNDSIIVNVNGMGFQIGFASTDRVKIGESVKVFTYLNVREDSLTLFGFLSQSDLNLFLRLISVKGIGPKGAMNFFSRSTGDRLIHAIEDGDVSYLKSLPGVGAKTASQIVLDLKGKLIDSDHNKGNVSQELMEAISGLKNLGYKQSELNAVEKELSKQPGLKTDEYIKQGLQLLLKMK